MRKNLVQLITINNCSNAKDIADIFATKYSDLYNSVGYNKDKMSSIISSVESNLSDECYNEHALVTPNEVLSAVKQLKSGKKDGYKGLFSDHIIKGTPTLYSILSKLFTTMLVHGHTPTEMRKATLISIPKDYSKPLSNSDNFRGISLLSMMCKLYDNILLTRYNNYLSTSDYQFAYKKGHSTVLCTALIKQTAEYYVSKGGVMYSCLADASKAYDRLRYDKLFELLHQKNVPPLILRLG